MRKLIMKKALDYSVKLWEKEKENLIKILKKYPGSLGDEISFYTKRLNNDKSDLYISDYNCLMFSYRSCAKKYYICKDDVLNCKKYFYLAAKALEMCYLLYDNGIPHGGANTYIITERREQLLGSFCALIAGNEKLALRLLSVKTLDGSLLESIILQDYEKERALFEEIDSHDGSIRALLGNVINKDEELLLQNIVKYIKAKRRQYSLDVILIDEYVLGILKLAHKHGMKCDIKAAELPMILLQDMEINFEEIKLPREAEMLELLRNCGKDLKSGNNQKETAIQSFFFNEEHGKFQSSNQGKKISKKYKESDRTMSVAEEKLWEQIEFNSKQMEEIMQNQQCDEEINQCEKIFIEYMQAYEELLLLDFERYGEDVAREYYELSNFYLQCKQEYDKAIEACEKSVGIYEKLLAESKNEYFLDGLGYAYEELAGIYEEVGDRKMSEEMYRKAEKINSERSI